MAGEVNALVVLNYNDWKTTTSLLEKVKDYKNIGHIIVVDNKSSDNSYNKLGMLKSEKIDVIQTDHNGGYAYGNDFGCRYAIEKYSPDNMIIANPDIMFSEGTLGKLVQGMNNLQDAGLVSCKMKCYSDIDLPEAWKIPDYQDCILENLMILRRLLGNKTRYKEKELIDNPTQVDVIAGSFFLLSTDTYCKINGFDIKTFLYYEENILAHKIRECGLKNYLFVDFEYDHYHSVSINRTFSSKIKRFRLAENSREYYVRNYLCCGPVKMVLLRASYYIGLLDYMIADSVRGIIRKTEK